MIDIKRSKHGCVTRYDLTFSSQEVADRAHRAILAVKRNASTPLPGRLTMMEICNKREAQAVEQQLAALQRALQPAPQQAQGNVVPLRPAAPTAVQAGRSWVHRELHLATSPVPPAQTLTLRDGSTVQFTGWGRGFICRDELEEPRFHGQPVHYAYYA